MIRSFRHAPHLRAVIAFSAAASVLAPAVHAHGRAGARFFPATIAIDDPATADELSLPVFSRFAGERAFEGEYSKRIFSNFGVSIGSARVRANEDGAISRGFENVETSFRYQFLTSARHETILSTGVSVEWGGTGSRALGVERTNTISPQFYFGKGFGDLPRRLDYLRPFALTGQASYAIPGRRFAADGEALPTVFSGGFTVQYSLNYLSSQVRDIGLPPFLSRLTPTAEFTFDKAVKRGDNAGATATANPGLFWIGKYFQVGTEAILPLNQHSGTRAGLALQLHFFFDDLFPRTLGKPIFGPPRPAYGAAGRQGGR